MHEKTTSRRINTGRSTSWYKYFSSVKSHEKLKGRRFVDSLAGKILVPVLTVVASFVALDVVIKPIFTGSEAERASIVKRTEDFYRQYQEYKADLLLAIEDRRAAAQKLTEYASSWNILGFESQYEAYFQTVQVWNQKAASLRYRGQHLTGCTDTAVSAKARKKMEAGAKGVWSDGYPVEAHRQIVADTSDGSGPVDGSFYCPDFYIFPSRSDEELISGTLADNDLRSVFEVFRLFHHYYSDSMKRDIVECAHAAEIIRDNQIKSCWPFSDERRIANCIEDAIALTQFEAACPRASYQGLAAMAQARFERLNLFVAIAGNQLDYYQGVAVARYCNSSKVFWFRYFWVFGDPCKDAERNYGT